MPRLFRLTAAATLLLALSLEEACQRRAAVVVGSKNFTEQVILGELCAQQIERKLHVQVDRKLNLGGTLLAHEAILKGDLDVYPEYTGTAASVVLKRQSATEPEQNYLEVKQAYAQQYGLLWLRPLGFNDTFTMVIRAADARKLPGATLSAAKSRPWHLGVGYEFLTRPDGLTRLNQTYQLAWSRTPVTMDLGLLYQAIRQGRVDMAAGNSTDAALSDPAFTALTDDRHAFPPYQACFVLRRDTAQRISGLREVLEQLSDRLDSDHMQQMNHAVDIEHRPVPRVVHDFLSANSQ